MIKHLPLFLFVFGLSFQVKAQVINPCAPIGSDLCVDAPLINSCQLNGWRSDTNPPDQNYQWNGDVPRRGWCNNGFSIENNQWLKFVAEEDHMYLDVDVSECDNGNGIQMACYLPGDDGCAGEQIACFGAQSGQNISTIFAMEPLIPGQTYLIMIDGWAGDGCPFTLWIESGVEIPLNLEVFTAALCPGYESIGVLSALGSELGPDFIFGWDTQNGNIVSGHFTLTPVIDEPGDYTFTAYNLETCCWASETVTVEIANIDDYPDAVASADNLLGCGEDNSVTLSAEGSSFDDVNQNPDFLYGWLDEDGNQIHTGFEFPGITEPGTYTLVVFNWRTGCSSQADVVVIEDTNPPALAPVSIGILDCNNTEVSIASNPDTTNYTFAWEGPNGFVSTDSTFAASESGTYSVTVTGANGCTSEYDIDVNSDYTEPEIMAEGGLLNCNDEEINLSVTSMEDIVSYSWQGPNGFSSSEQNPLVNTAGEYQVTAVGLNGCVQTFNVNVDDDFEEPEADLMVDGLIDCNVSEVLLSISSDSDIVSFSWLGPNGFSSTEEAPLANESGEYTLTITASNGCQNTFPITVDDDFTSPEIMFETPEILTCDITEIDISASSDQMNADYTWFADGAELGTGNELEVNAPGTYTLIVTASNGCTHEESITVAEDVNPPLADAGPNGLITCQDTEAMLNGGASETGDNITYTWFGSGGNELGTEVTLGVANPGIYTLVVTNLENGCSSTDDVEIAADESLPVADAGPEMFLTCDEESISLDGSNSSAGPTITYLWQDEFGNTIGNDLNQNITQPGVYTLVVSDASNGCVTESQVQVTQDIEDPILNIEPTMVLNCNNLSVTLDASASTGGDDLQFTWTSSDGQLVSTESTGTVSQAGTYTVSLLNVNNGCVVSEEVVVEEDFVQPQADPGNPFTITCTESSGTLNAAGSSGSNLAFLWIDASGQELSQDAMFEVELSGTYTLIVSNQDNGCTDMAEITIEEDTDFPVVETLADGILTCENQSVNLDGSNSSQGSDFSYEWLNESGEVISTDLLASTDLPGTYTLVVSNNANSCQSEMELVVEQNIDPPVADAGLPLTITCDATSVTLDGTGSSFGINYSYTWQNSNGLIVGEEIELAIANPDIYTLTVYDLDNGCSSQSIVEVVPDENIPVSMVQVDDVLDCNVNTVNLSSIGSSSGSNISQVWLSPNGNPLSEEDDIEITEPGIYTLQLIDQTNGCSSEASIEVMQNTLSPELELIDPAIITCANAEVLLEINANSLSENFQGDLIFNWFDASGNDIASSEDILIDQSGTYTIIVTDPSNGCTTSLEFDVLENLEDPVSDAGLPATLTCETNVLNLGGSSTSLGPEFTYEWQDEAGNVVGTEPSLEVSEAGTYSLMVTNSENACQDMSSVFIAQDADFPNVDAGPPGLLTCEFTSLTIGSQNTDQGNEIRYEWLDENNNIVGEELEIEIDAPGEYELIVFNESNGCSAVSSVMVEQDILPPAININEPDIITCTAPEVILSAFGSSDGPNITYRWVDANGTDIGTEENIVVSDPEQYTLIVTDLNNGCSSTLDVDVQVDENTPVAIAGPDQTLTCDVELVILDAGNSNANAGVLYEWRDANGQVLSNDVTFETTLAGQYTLHLFDPMNGCQDENTLTVFQDIEAPLASANVNGDLTCTDPVQILSAVGSSEGDDYEYEWTDANGNVVSTALTFESSIPGDYNLTVLNTLNGCSTSAALRLNENQIDPRAVAEILGPQTLNCQTSSILLDGTASEPFEDLMLTWSDVNGNIIESSDQIEIDEAGVYTLLVTDLINGCTNETQIEIDEDRDDPIIEILPPPIINCYEPQITLDATASSSGAMFEIFWFSPSGSSLSNNNVLNPEVTEAGVYSLTIINTLNGCEVSQELEVFSDLEAPEVETAVNDVLDCVTERVQLDGTGSSEGSNFTYQWSGPHDVLNSNSLNPSVTEPGTYELLVTNTENGCVSLREILVERNDAEPTDAIIDLADITCFGSNDGRIAIEGIIGGTEPYQYSFMGSEFNSEIVFENLGPGVYPLQVIDAIGCQWETVLNVIEPPQVFVDLGPDLEIELGDVVDLFANTNGNNIEWMSDNDDLDCIDDCFTQEVSPFFTSTYFVEVTDKNGCPALDEVLLRVDRTRAVYIPNAFSPNGDGINDFFTVYKNKTIKEVKKMLIADRWGEIVFVAENFEPEDPAFGWNGDLRNTALNNGVFVYYAEVEFVDGFIGKYKGDVTLMR